MRNTESRLTPEKIPSLSDIKAIACGDYHSLVLTSNGNVFSFGLNEDGELGLGHIRNMSTPTQIQLENPAKLISCGYFYSMIVDDNGDLYTCGLNSKGQLGLGDVRQRNIPTKVSNIENVCVISSGSFSTIVKTLNDEIWIFGDNSKDQFSYWIKDTPFIVLPRLLPKEYFHLIGMPHNGSRMKSARK